MPEDNRLPRWRKSELGIRAAQSSDIQSLARLEAEAFATDRLSRARLRALAQSPSASMLVAEHRAELLGYVLVLMRRNSRAARLYSLAVAPASLGRGVGSALLRAAEDSARARGADELRLEVRDDNAAAQRLYAARGYAQLGRREDYYEDGAAALLFARSLRPPLRGSDPASVRAA